ncbi:hypothetical protein H632_c1238p1 [Helicosporidium sp. ATCC 50920]|nr:hypothetical protein H632_c1238p1 [Helicosporidium sp. ATCC 50920]|eukprot:KDD74547.1 hypothetical protein H632_c1238p1 [Helicosporidium sp. ATCC 50920]
MNVLGDALLEVEAGQKRLADDGDEGSDGGVHSEREWVTKVWAFGPRKDLTDGLIRLAGMQTRQSSFCPPPFHPSAPLSGYFSLTSTRDLLAGDTGCHEWEAGLALAELVLSQRSEIAGRSCLELGCGAGAASLAALLCGARSVVCTDGDALALQNCGRNLARNGFEVANSRLDEALSGGACGLPEGAFTWKMDWGCEVLPPCIAQGPDLLLGADLVYDTPSSYALFRCVKKILSSTPDRRDRALVLATTLRTPETLPRLEGAAREAGGLSLQRMGDWDAGCASRLWHVPQLEAARPSIVFHRVVHLPPGA